MPVLSYEVNVSPRCTRLLTPSYKKATQAINYFAKQEGGEIDKLKLIKLIYFADRYHLRRYGRPMVNDAYLAMPLGPVGSSVKDIAEFSDFLDVHERRYATEFLKKGSTKNTIASRANVDTDIFSASELEALTFAYDAFGKYTASTLVNITHRYPEWEKYKSVLESRETTREPMSYSDFFGNPMKGPADQFALSGDILNASKELFEEDYKIAEF